MIGSSDSLSFVSIILLNYNNVEYNSNCINSVLNQDYINFEIIIVNNASDDGSIDVIKSEFGEIISSGKIIIAQPESNLGFAGGNNFALQFTSSQSKYICLLNNDTVVSSSWLGKLVRAMDDDLSLGGVGSMIIDLGYEKDIAEFMKDRKIVANMFCDSVFHNLNEEEKQSKIRYTSVLSGCSFLYRKEIIEKPFLSEYFAYGEDVWLSLKILSQGYRLAMVTDSIVHHFGSVSFGKNPSVLKSFHGTKNQICNFIFYHQGFQLYALLPRFLLIQISQLCLGDPIIRLQGKLNAIVRIFKYRSRIAQEKKLILSKRTASDKEFYGQLSYKFTDEMYFVKFSRFQKKIINFINFVIFYCLRILKITFQS